MEEKEIKIRLSKETFDELNNIAKSKLTLAQESNQKDVYFDNDQMYINNLNRGLRVRFDDDKPKTIEFKSLFYNINSRKDNPWFIEEISFPIALSQKDIDQFLSIFTRLKLEKPNLASKEYSYPMLKEELASIGIVPKITVTKHRQIFKSEVAEFVFDFIEELGYFVEIETNDASDPLDLVKGLIGEKPFQFIRNGYNDMAALDIPYCLSNDIKQQLFKINPKWNVLESEVSLVNDLLQKTA